MKIGLLPDSLARSKAYLMLSILLAALIFSTSIQYSPFIALMSVIVCAGACANLFFIQRRQLPPKALVVVTICPLLPLFPIGTTLACAIYIALNRKDSKDCFAGTWRPTRETLAKLRNDKAGRSADALALLLFILGGAAAFFLTALACQMHSKEAMQVGWVFCFFTVPFGAFIGFLVGVLLGKWWRGGIPCTYCGYRISFRTKICPKCQSSILPQANTKLNPTR